MGMEPKPLHNDVIRSPSDVTQDFSPDFKFEANQQGDQNGLMMVLYGHPQHIL
jgi:hypothetical protein